MLDKTTAKHIFDILRNNYWNNNLKTGGIYMTGKEFNELKESIIDDCGIEMQDISR